MNGRGSACTELLDPVNIYNCKVYALIAFDGQYSWDNLPVHVSARLSMGISI